MTETHLSEDIDDDDEITLDGYTLFRLDRNRHSGGIALCCRSELEPKLISNLTVENIECYGLKLPCIKIKSSSEFATDPQTKLLVNAPFS